MQKKYYLFQMSGVALNVVSVIIFLVMVWITGCIYSDSTFVITDETFILVIALMIPYLMLHELLHSVSYVLHGADFKNVTYGMHLEKGIFCCLCKQNITKKNILISIMYPFIFIGVITYIIGVMIDNSVLILLSIINISGCAGDLVMFFDLLGVKNIEYSEYDNPMAFGLYSSENLSKLKLFGLKHVGEQEQLEREDLKKVKVSVFSAVIIGLIALSVISMLFLKGITDSENEERVAGKTYTYVGDSVSAMGNDCFTITINEDGTFTYYESAFSSYIGIGKWSVENGVITLTEDEQMDNARVNHFQIVDNEIVFIEDDSSNFIYINVKDGDRFTCDLDMSELHTLDDNLEEEEKLPAEKKQIDYSGIYTDKQGTSDTIYSELKMHLQEDNSYSVTLGIYRVAGLDGIATYENGVLHFVCDEPHVEGDITINGDTAEVIITESSFSGIEVGESYAFPDGKE